MLSYSSKSHAAACLGFAQRVPRCWCRDRLNWSLSNPRTAASPLLAMPAGHAPLALDARTLRNLSTTAQSGSELWLHHYQTVGLAASVNCGGKKLIKVVQEDMNRHLLKNVELIIAMACSLELSGSLKPLKQAEPPVKGESIVEMLHFGLIFRQQFCVDHGRRDECIVRQKITHVLIVAFSNFLGSEKELFDLCANIFQV